MNIFKSLNSVSNYIEQHLYDEIDFNYFSVLTGINLYSLNNAFSLLTNYTLKEYLRLRRLSNCFMLLRDKKIIDVALLCGYNSPTSFSRAFFKLHGFNPSSIKNESNFKYFPKIVFEEKQTQPQGVQIEYKNLTELVLFGECTNCNVPAEHETVETFWREMKTRYSKLSQAEKQFGLVEYISPNNFNYYITLPKKFAKSNKKIILSGGKYMSVFFNSKKAKEISNFSASLVHEYHIKNIDIEIYSNNGVELLFKQ